MTPTPEPAPTQSNDGEPKVPREGERWIVSVLKMNGSYGPEATVTVGRALHGGHAICFSPPALECSAAYIPGKHVLGNCCFIRPTDTVSPSPAPVEAPLVVGAEYEGIGHQESAYRGELVRGVLVAEDIANTFPAGVPLRPGKHAPWIAVLRSTLKRIPDAGEGKAPPVVKVDPYTAPPSQYEAWAKAQDERHRAALEKHKADFDRKLPARGKWDWDVDDTEDPRVT